LLATSAGLPQFLQDLLTPHPAQVAGTEAAGFLIEKTEQGVGLKVVAHVRNDNAPAETRQQALNAFAEMMKPCIEQGKDAVIQVTPEGDGVDISEPQFCLVTLLRADGNVVAISGVITRCRDVDRAQQRLQAMQLVAGYFELFTMRRSLEQTRDTALTHQNVLQLAGAVATAEGFQGAAMNLCNELAARTGATRVSLGWLHGNTVKLKSLSHTEEFDKKQEMAIAIVRTMEECVDQEEIVRFSPDGQSTANVTRAAQQLSTLNGGQEILSLPLRYHDRIVGVITLQFTRGHELDARAATSLAVCTELLAPQLSYRFNNDRWLITKAGLSVKYTAELAVGPKHMVAKLVIIATVSLLLFITLYRPIFRVSAPFTFVPVDKRVLSAPFDGYVWKVNFRKGDSFKAGDVLVEMDQHELINELARAEAGAASKHDEYLRNMADKKVAEAQEAHDEEKAYDADVATAQYNIDRAKVRAPFDGQILQGDMEDKQGSSLKKGDPMFEIAAQNTRIEAEMEIAERDIQWVAGGGTQVGYLATDALPTDKHSFHVRRVVPLGNAKEGANVFKVYADIDDPLDAWRPGMRGEARVQVGRRPLIWIWSHHLVDWLRIKLWV
jgi:multidrug efflux pump subunit AcrA (membrane-fusion protein)